MTGNRGRGVNDNPRGQRGGVSRGTNRQTRQSGRNSSGNEQVRVEAGGRSRGGGTRASEVGQNETTSCSFCDDSLGDNPVGCDLCPNWFHSTTLCTGLRDETINAILGPDGSAIRFICCYCRCLAPASPSNAPNDSQMGLSQLFMTVQSLAKSVQELAAQVATIVNVSPAVINNNPGNSNPPSSASNDQQFIKRTELFSEIRELEERKKRINSSIVRGIEADTSYNKN